MENIRSLVRAMETVRKAFKRSQPDPNCGVRFAPMSYFWKQKPINKGTPKKGIAIFPKTLSEDAWQEAVKETAAYQQGLLEKHKFNTGGSEDENA